MLKIRIVFVERRISHPVNLELVGVQRLLDGGGVGLYRPVVGVPEVETIFALEARHAGF